MDGAATEQDSCPAWSPFTVIGEPLVKQRDCAALFVCRSTEHKDDDVLRTGYVNTSFAVLGENEPSSPLRPGILIPLHERIARLPQPAFDQQIERRRQMRRVLRVDILDALES